MNTTEYPRKLYKYFAPERVSALDSAMLRYTPLGGFNDPFEGRPEITGLSSDQQAMETFNKVFPKEAVSAYKQLTAAEKARLPLFQFMAHFSSLVDAKKPEMLQELRKLTPLVKTWLHEKFDETIGALCLSEVPDSLLMWSHYAAGHTGFALEFNGHHPHFHERKTDQDELRHLRRVLYRDDRPSASLSEMEGSEFFFVKSTHWAYEREWRIFRALSQAESVMPCQPFPIHLFGFPRSAVTSVIIGARSSKQNEHQIRDILSSHNDYGAVALKRAHPSPSHFLLKIERVTA